MYEEKLANILSVAINSDLLDRFRYRYEDILREIIDECLLPYCLYTRNDKIIIIGWFFDPSFRIFLFDVSKILEEGDYIKIELYPYYKATTVVRLFLYRRKQDREFKFTFHEIMAYPIFTLFLDGYYKDEKLKSTLYKTVKYKEYKAFPEEEIKLNVNKMIDIISKKTLSHSIAYCTPFYPCSYLFEITMVSNFEIDEKERVVKEKSIYKSYIHIKMYPIRLTHEMRNIVDIDIVPKEKIRGSVLNKLVSMLKLVISDIIPLFLEYLIKEKPSLLVHFVK